jgi:hypothetical protein
MVGERLAALAQRAALESMVMGPEIASGLFALGGVIVGAVATTGSQVYLEGKRDARTSDRAKRLVAGELLHVQLMLRSIVAHGEWPVVGGGEVFLPTSAWKEHRALLADSVDQDLFEALVIAYAGLDFDQARIDHAGTIPPRPLPDEALLNLKRAGFQLGGLRRRITGGGGGWLDEGFEEVRKPFEDLVDGYSEEALEDASLVAQLRELASEIAGLSDDEGPDWLREINRKLGDEQSPEPS